MRHGRVVIAATVLLAAGLGGAYWWWWSETSRATGNAASPVFDADDYATDPSVQRLIEKYIGAAAEQPGAASRWTRLGMAFEANDFRAEALQCYQYAAELDSTDARLWYRMAVASVASGLPEQAETMFDEAINRTGDYAPAYWRRGAVQLTLGDLDGAEESFVRATEIDPRSSAARMGIARVQLERGQADRAIETLTQIRSEQPRNGYALFLLGTAYRKAERHAEARELLATGDPTPPIEFDPWHQDLDPFLVGFGSRMKEAVKWVRAGQAQRAMPILEQLFAEEPDHMTVMTNLGAAYVLVRRYDDAIPLLLRAHEANPKLHAVAMNLALAYFMRNEHDRALIFAQRAIDNNSVAPRPYELIADIMMSRKRFDVAASRLEQARPLDPRNPQLLVNLARAQSELQRWEDAAETYLQAVTIVPRADLMLRLARCRFMADDIDGAMQALDQARSLGADENTINRMLEALERRPRATDIDNGPTRDH